MGMQRSEVKSVYADAERRPVRRARAANTDSSLANRSSSVIHVSHQIFLPGLTEMTGRAALGIHLWLSRVTTWESPLGSPILISSHLGGALEARSEREITRH